MSNAIDWLRRLWPARRADADAQRWRSAWAEAVSRPEPGRIRALRAELEQLTATATDDFEIEREMLEALEQLLEFAAAAANGLPSTPTGHRVVGGDVCHLSAPASMPDDPAQPSGRLLLTNTRAIFVGGARSVTLAWHAVGKCLQTDRDLVLVRVDGTAVHRFRCNSFEDALKAAFIAERMKSKN